MPQTIKKIGGICVFINQGFKRLEEGFLCLLLLAMILLSCSQIFLRDFFDGGGLWIDPLLRYLVLWAGMFGAAVATRHSKHISIDITSHLLPAHLLPWLRLLLNLFGAGICGVLTYASVIFVINEASFGEASGILNLSSWQMNLVFPLAFGLMACRFLGLAVDNLRDLLRGSDHGMGPRPDQEEARP